MKKKNNKLWWVVYLIFVALFAFVIFKSLSIGSTLDAFIFGVIFLFVYCIKNVKYAVAYLFCFFFIGAVIAASPQWFDGLGLDKLGLKSVSYETFKTNKQKYLAEITEHVEAGKISSARDLISKYDKFNDLDFKKLKIKLQPEFEKLDENIRQEKIAKISKLIEAGKFDKARNLIFETDGLSDPDLEKLKAALQHKQIQVESDQIAELQKELNALADDDYEKRNELLTKITNIPLGNISDNHRALEENKKRWDEVKARQGNFENDCNSNGAKSLAYVMLRERVKQRLSAPASAKFPWANEIEINVTKPCDFAINGYVDSQNKYGAMIRTFYKGTLRRDLENKDRFIFIKVDM